MIRPKVATRIYEERLLNMGEVLADVEHKTLLTMKLLMLFESCQEEQAEVLAVAAVAVQVLMPAMSLVEEEEVEM